MSTMYYEIEIAHRREQLLQVRKEAGSSRRDRRRQARLAEGQPDSAPSARVLRPLPSPRLG